MIQLIIIAYIVIGTIVYLSCYLFFEQFMSFVKFILGEEPDSNNGDRNAVSLLFAIPWILWLAALFIYGLFKIPLSLMLYGIIRLRDFLDEKVGTSGRN